MSHPEQGRTTDPTADHERPGGYDEDPRQNAGVPEQVRHTDDQQAYGGHPGGPVPPQQTGPTPGGPGVGGQPGAYPGPPDHGHGAPGRPPGDGRAGYGGDQAGYGGDQAGYGGDQAGYGGDQAGYGAAPTGAHDGTTPEAGDGRQPAEHGTIFDPDRASQWRSQWEDVRMMFVDRPQDAAARADGLVGEVLGELSRTFTDQRSALDPQVLGGEPSTEELRRAVQRYREFFDRLLTL